MTKEEISSARALCALGQTTFSARVYRDYCERALGLLPKALDALEAANREIERLAKIVSKIESELCGARVYPSCVCCDETRKILELPIGESTT